MTAAFIGDHQIDADSGQRDDRAAKLREVYQHFGLLFADHPGIVCSLTISDRGKRGRRIVAGAGSVIVRAAPSGDIQKAFTGRS